MNILNSQLHNIQLDQFLQDDRSVSTNLFHLQTLKYEFQTDVWTLCISAGYTLGTQFCLTDSLARQVVINIKI
jgi:hypothetical protein